MARKSGRKLLLSVMLFAFACLLVSGGSRLVAGEGEQGPVPARPFASVRAALSAAPVQRAETASTMRSEQTVQRVHSACAPECQVPVCGAASDANGNVLAAGTSYMRAVYQAFVLDDGFV